MKGVLRTGLALLLLLCACSTHRKMASLRAGAVSPSITVADDIRPEQIGFRMPVRDTLKVRDADGRELLIMQAVKDEDGEMVATEMLNPVVVTAAFKNTAERHGKVDLRFNVIIPARMQDSRWQIRLRPLLCVSDEEMELLPVVITGEQYRRAQLRGYQQYRNFVNSIITDSAEFIRTHDLEVFLARNLPEIYALRTDSSYVSDEAVASMFGVTRGEAVDHYTDRLRILLNDRRRSLLPDRYRRYVKVPIITEGLKLDTVIRTDTGDISYEYVQTIAARPSLRRALITLGGDIYEEDRKLFDLPRQDTLTFYISSLSSLVDDTRRYLTRIVERRVEDNSVCWIEFAAGSSTVDPQRGNNESEIGRIKSNLAQLLDDVRFDLDSIVVTASASPEGSYPSNRTLSQRRSEAVSRYFSAFVRAYRDSIQAETGLRLNLDSAYVEPSRAPSLKFIPESIAENWSMLRSLVEADEDLLPEDKADFLQALRLEDPDRREREIASRPYYRYLREHLYPRLRTVKFSFYLHRRGMVQDTIHTTVLDSAYMAGVQAVRDRDYTRAISLLRPYRDFNTAVAYAALDYNASAMDILDRIPASPSREYMRAIVLSRLDRTQEAVQSFLDACAGDPSFVHRGNLDPEISELIHKYNLNTIYEDY